MIRSWLLFVSVSAVSAFFASILNTSLTGQGLTKWVALLSLSSGFLSSGFVSLKNVRRFQQLWREWGRVGQAFFLFLMLGSGLSFVSLFNEANGRWGTSSPNNLGDLPFHLHLIGFFSRGAPFPPQDPTFAGELLRYPFGLDLWDAMWVTLGLPVGQSLAITGLLSLLITFVALWRAGGLLLVSAFFFSGGVSLVIGWSSTFGPSSPLVWKNLFHALFVTQRGFLWALPAGLYLIQKWNLFIQDRMNGEFNKKGFWIPGVFFSIWAVMPFFHLHTFVVLSFWMGLTILMIRKIPLRMITASFVALGFLLRSVTTGNVQSSLSWDWGWMFKGPMDVALNLGPWCILPFFISMRWIQQRRWRKVFVAFVLTFVALNLKLAPWAWDQVKVLIWVYLLWTIWAVQEYNWKKGSAALFSLFLFWPGALQWFSGWPAFAGRFEIQDGADRAILEKLISDLSPGETVAAQIDHRHPLLGLGQSLALGMPGHAWSHGLPIGERSAGLEKILSGLPGGDNFANEIGVKWVVAKGNPSPAWTAWGWKEEKRIGEWSLWKTSRAQATR